jgi:AraC family transcriptional regulator, transcriptional activator FtrA
VAKSQYSSISRQRVAALVLPGVVTFDLGCAIQVFARAPGTSGPGYYDLVTCGPSRRMPTSDGFDLAIDHGLDALTDADTVIVLGYATWAQPPPAVATRALAAAADRGARMMSFCVGAFALAHAGILDGRRATTHWMGAGLLAEQFPRVEVVADVLYVDEGKVLTSAGLAAGLDLGLHVVRADHGAEAAAELARFNVVAPHRDGGQAQFTLRPISAAPDTGLSATRVWAIENLGHPITLANLAAHACCSERTLVRRFREETGVSPKRWLLQMRLERARELLELTEIPVEQVAAQSGFPSAGALRAHFAEDLRTTPTAYRRIYRGRPATVPTRRSLRARR